MKLISPACFIFGCLVHLALGCVPAQAATGKKVGPTKEDVLSWPRTPADAFGCFLEKTFGVRDAHFNCSLKIYVNKGDPCKNTKAYYEGPAFPVDQSSQIDAAVESVALSWEHGNLQSVRLTLKTKMPAEDVRKIFHLPPQRDNPRENVMSVDVQDCSKKSTCLLIQGFDHLGAGDVDCGAD